MVWMIVIKAEISEIMAERTEKLSEVTFFCKVLLLFIFLKYKPVIIRIWSVRG